MKFPPWLLALGATLLAQSAASFMGQCLPVVAPLLTAASGVAPERIGNLSSLVSFGTVLFLAFGSPFLARLGPVRSLQIGSGFAVAGLLVAASGVWPALLLAAVLLGIGYGPTPPAGSRILAATAPPAHRTLIFSIKQAGAPAGGALAGLIVAPLAAAFGWQPALLLAMAVGVGSACLISPLRATMDSERDPARSIHPRDVLHIRTLRAPLDALFVSPEMMSLTALAVSFAIVQGCLFSFSVTYLTRNGLDLVQAGIAYTGLQGAGVFARIFLGWLADRTGRPVHNLVAQAFVAAAAVAAYGLLPQGAGLLPTALLAMLAGFFGCSWNGITLAEVARLSAPERIADATSGSTLFIFVGYVVGPSLFALLVPVLGWHLPFMLAGAPLAAMAVVQCAILWRRGRTRRSGSGL